MEGQTENPNIEVQENVELEAKIASNTRKARLKAELDAIITKYANEYHLEALEVIEVTAEINQDMIDIIRNWHEEEEEEQEEESGE